MASFYEPHHRTPQDVKFDSTQIGDRQPYPILSVLITDAFKLRKNDETIVMFTNADIRLRTNYEYVIKKRVEYQTTHFEPCIHTRPQKESEAQSDPVTFFFSYVWWEANKIYIPPVFFACPYWEHPYQSIIARTTAGALTLPRCTSHIPHQFFKPFSLWRSPARMYNHALTDGWTNHRFDTPSLGRGLKTKRKP